MTEQEITKTYRREVLKRYTLDRLTVVPLALGLTGIIGAWALSSPLFLIGGIIILGLGTYGFFARLNGEDDTIEKSIQKRFKAEAQQRTQVYLDELEKVLTITPDPRDENALRDLRGLLTAFHENKTWERNVDPSSAINIREGVDRLFKGAIETLRESYSLLVQNQKTSSFKVKEANLLRREMLISEVEASVHRLERLFEELQTMRPLDETGEDLAALRDELDINLQIAIKVAEGIDDWDDLERHDLSDLDSGLE